MASRYETLEPLAVFTPTNREDVVVVVRSQTQLLFQIPVIITNCVEENAVTGRHCEDFTVRTPAEVSYDQVILDIKTSMSKTILLKEGYNLLVWFPDRSRNNSS